MGVHAFTEYIKYRWRAKGRHGTHSPFVYALVEDVLHAKVQGKGLVFHHFKDSHYGALLSAITAYYGYKSLLDLTSEAPLRPTSFTEENLAYDVLLLPETQPEHWQSLLHQYGYIIEAGGVIVVPAIHTAKDYTENWNKIGADEAVKMSIDIYGIGLLFAKKEFKVKQHFVLR